MIDRAEMTDRYAAVGERIAAAAGRANRDPASITLVAVTKTWPSALIVSAYQVGMRHFGENRVEELVEKRPAVAAALGDSAVPTWHMIGTVQSRKTAGVADHADVFHALDREKIVIRLSRRLQENSRQLPVFIEVNMSGETSKGGLDCTNWEEDATQRQQLRTVIEQVAALPGLQPSGLMTMAPWHVAEDEIRSVFRRTSQLDAWLRTGDLPDSWAWLSMGMTDDFEIAIEEGATHVRIGRALFGERQQ